MKGKILAIIICMLMTTTAISTIPAVREEKRVDHTILNGGWMKTYGGDGLDCFKGLDLTTDDCLVMAGETEVDGNKEGWIVKTDSDGNQLWEVTYGTPNGADGLWPVIETSDGDILAGGWLYNNSQEQADGLLIKIDENGNILWTNTYGGDGGEGIYSILEIVDGYFGIGQSSSFGSGGYEAYMIKVDFEGNMIWSKTFQKEGYGSEIDSIIPANEENGYIISGGHYSTEEPCQGWLFKIDDTGSIIWEKNYGTDIFWDWYNTKGDS